MVICGSNRSDGLCDDQSLLLEMNLDLSIQMKNTSFIGGFLLLVSTLSHAQCAMCKAVVENGDSDMAEGLNDGIVTLMVIPYVLVGIVAFVFWKFYKKSRVDV